MRQDCEHRWVTGGRATGVDRPMSLFQIDCSDSSVRQRLMKRGSPLTLLRTHETWIYLAVVLDLFSRRVIGWSMQSRITKELALNALLMAVWRRNPQSAVTVHSDQGSQYTSHEWQAFLKEHGLEGSMSRRGNCHDNAVAESFFQLLKRERIRRHIYSTREAARSDVFNYIEMFYNTRRRHGFNNQLSPVGYEAQYQERLASV